MQIQQQICNEYMSKKKDIPLSRNQYVTTRNIFFFFFTKSIDIFIGYYLLCIERESRFIMLLKYMCTVSSYRCCIRYLFTSDFDFSMYLAAAARAQFRSLRIVLTKEHGFETRLFNIGDRQTVQIYVCEFVCA